MIPSSQIDHQHQIHQQSNVQSELFLKSLEETFALSQQALTAAKELLSDTNEENHADSESDQFQSQLLNQSTPNFSSNQNSNNNPRQVQQGFDQKVPEGQQIVLATGLEVEWLGQSLHGLSTNFNQEAIQQAMNRYKKNPQENAYYQKIRHQVIQRKKQLIVQGRPQERQRLPLPKSREEKLKLLLKKIDQSKEIKKPTKFVDHRPNQVPYFGQRTGPSTQDEGSTRDESLRNPQLSQQSSQLALQMTKHANLKSQPCLNHLPIKVSKNGISDQIGAPKSQLLQLQDTKTSTDNSPSNSPKDSPKASKKGQKGKFVTFQATVGQVNGQNMKSQGPIMF